MGATRPKAAEDQTETLEYIRAMLGPLKDMAQAAGHQLLAYLLDMALVEAGQRADELRKGKTSK